MDPSGGNVVRLTDGSGSDVSPSWSPDGNTIAFSAATEGSPEDRDPTWAPDGTLIAFVRDGDIYEIHPDGSEVTEVTDDGAGYSDLAWQAVPAKVLTSTPSSQT